MIYDRVAISLTHYIDNDDSNDSNDGDDDNNNDNGDDDNNNNNNNMQVGYVATDESVSRMGVSCRVAVASR